MKKIVFLLLAMGLYMNGFAQKGMSGIGGNIVGGTETKNHFSFMGFGIKYQYNFSDYFRIEPSVEALPIHQTKTEKVGDRDLKVYNHLQVKAFVNGHLFLMAPRQIRPYVLAGAGFANWNKKSSGVGTEGANSANSDNSFAWNAGVGCDFRLSHSFAMQVEATMLNNVTGKGTDDVYYNNYQDPIYYNNKGNWAFLGRIGFTYNF